MLWAGESWAWYCCRITLKRSLSTADASSKGWEQRTLIHLTPAMGIRKVQHLWLSRKSSTLRFGAFLTDTSLHYTTLPVVYKPVGYPFLLRTQCPPLLGYLFGDIHKFDSCKRRAKEETCNQKTTGIPCPDTVGTILSELDYDVTAEAVRNICHILLCGLGLYLTNVKSCPWKKSYFLIGIRHCPPEFAEQILMVFSLN